MSSQRTRRTTKSDSINTKIIEPLKEGAFVVGPGQMATPLTKKIANGVKTSHRKKRKHTDSQSDYQSLDEMLTDPNQSLNYGNPDGVVNGIGFDVPTTGNLVNTLVQGLQSHNDQMVKTVLERQDAYLIRDTVHNLPNEMVDEFLRKLHKLFFMKGDQLINYYVWLTSLLQEKMSVILMSQNAQQELASLRQLFATRCDIFDRMCALHGRLNLISSLLEPNSKDKELPSKNDAIHYQESEEEDANEANGQDDEDDNSDLESEDRDLEKIIVMDLSDTEKNSQEEEDDDEDDDEDDEDALDSDGKENVDDDIEVDDTDGDGGDGGDDDGDDEDDDSD